MNSVRSNVKLKGQMNLEFDEFAIHGKLMKGEESNETKSSDLELYSERYPIFKISEILD